MAPLTPEQLARQHIDEMLEESRWIIQDKKRINLHAGSGIAIREYPTDTGPVDYALFVDGRPVGVIEAKKEGTLLIPVEEQSDRYRQSQLKWKVNKEPLRFTYESTGRETQFTDYNDPKPRSREVFHFHQPAALKEWMEEGRSLKDRLIDIPAFVNPKRKFRDCQERAIVNLESSFKQFRPRALIQMATGSGKTFTAITAVYRLLKYAKAKRILFLVDTRNLGIQAEQEFQAYEPVDDKRKFKELYNVQRLSSNFIDKSSQVCISTIQRMYSILRGEADLPEGSEDNSLYEVQQVQRPKEVAYNDQVPIETFDFIIIDECHRSIYNLWQQVLDYFDASLIGLTATPDSRTFGFFHQNIVSEYSHEEAVADGVNVGYDVYLIETELTRQGAMIEAKQYVELRSRLTREKRWNQLDEEITYTGKDLDRDVVNLNQIRTVVRAFRDKITTEIFPGRKEIPKTLIFAKTDSHADDIIRIVREEFGEGNAFCKKITYNNKEEDPSSVLQQFRTAYNPRIAVTVDMVATGTDVKPLECLLFMRDVKSRNYFEQMKGRGTRTLKKDDLRKVTPSAIANKSHFVIVDAVGVTKSVKTDSRPLERKPTVPLKDLMINVIMGQRDEDTVTSLANRLTRLEKEISPKEKTDFKSHTQGKSINEVVKEMLNAFDPDRHIEKAKEWFKDEIGTGNPTPSHLDRTKDRLAKEATEVFNNPDLRDFIDNARRVYEQVMDDINIDRVIEIGWDTESGIKAEDVIDTFKKFLEENKDKITALKIFYDQPWRRRKLTFRMIKELTEALSSPPWQLAIEKIWYAYDQVFRDKVKGATASRKLTDIVSLIRFELKIDKELRPYEELVNQRFKEWIFKKNAGPVQFTKEQTEWLRMIKDHIITSVHFEKEDLDYAPFDAQGGVGMMWKLFGEDMDKIINELNEEIAA